MTTRTWGYEFGMHIHEVLEALMLTTLPVASIVEGHVTLLLRQGNQLSPSRRQLICYTIRSVLWPLRRPLILLFVLETDYLELCNWMHSHMATSFAAYSVADLARYPPREMAWRVGRCLHAYMHGLDIGQGCRNARTARQSQRVRVAAVGIKNTEMLLLCPELVLKHLPGVSRSTVASISSGAPSRQAYKKFGFDPWLISKLRGFRHIRSSLES
ncbi:uncharacterized protein CIMG_10933 [Coccidioides immitis RS]|uniref:Uncharacterized protein n=1 Tax=Coccidioides immitis (strain RS) TaxID=246410 RepID=A0A0D8JUR8_COCIM|nr:uncharacterized protein CIMG_10933 [Coccidioides immitis RS]KJF60023.1 hypothetical protein CIMG_10933 [Coccidioides immitis RS]